MKKGHKIVIFILVFIVIFAVYVFTENKKIDNLEIYVFNIKTGHSTFIRTNNDIRILIGGGGNSEIMRLLTSILPFYSHKIDYIVVPNTLDKEIVGLIQVLERYKVSNIIFPEITDHDLKISTSTIDIYFLLKKNAERKKINIQYYKQNSVLDLGSKDLTSFCNSICNDHLPINDHTKILFRFPAPMEDFIYSKSSAPSAIFDIDFGQNNFIFLGDTTKKIQTYIADHIAENSRFGAIIYYSNDSLTNISRLLFEKTKPLFFIYSRSTNREQNISKNTQNKESKIDKINTGEKINIREYQYIKISSDGNDIKIIKKTI